MIQFDSMIRFEDMAAWSGRNFAAAEFELHFRVFGAFLARARVYSGGVVPLSRPTCRSIALVYIK